ncbi:MAG: TonB-dependent receptor [Candidatus Marinimicrobia bacterium]|nr:TonB-dependent receptor [Candidatus Neomarinimicrobiota bacterium]MCF7828198.1 TonB-dependent receptor [Candidatus Neomarinimicrobiota bacterium]MCF7879627.1 TonB-dependent receptor [Candidatus Neomarinimicrobiota bacterium]
MVRRGTLFLLTMLVAAGLLAQSAGKISGTITDSETGEPLAGANILVEGTNYGASADTDGNYSILDVPPGTYTVTASFIGYSTIEKSNVQVTSGLTTRLNFEMETSAIEGDRVEVTVERPLVQPTATNVQRTISQDEFENIPTRNVQTFYSMQAGVVEQNGEIHIRGGRASETGYMLEGSSIKGMVGSDAVVTTIPEALEQVNVQSGGYSAEIGNANAGIVQQSFRTGGQRFSGSVQYETDTFGSALGDNSYSYGYNDFTATLGGPLFSQRHRFFVAIDKSYTDDYNPSFWTGADFDTLYDSGSSGAPIGQPSPGEVAWEDGNLPGDSPRFQDQLTANGSFLLDFNPLRFRIAFARTDRTRQINTVPIWDMFNQKRLSHREDTRQLYNLRGTYFFDNNTFVQAQVSYFDYDFEVFDPNFDQPEADGAGGAVWDLMDYIDNAPESVDGDPHGLLESGLYTIAEEADTMFNQNGEIVEDVNGNQIIVEPGDTVHSEYGFDYYRGYYQEPAELTYHGFRFTAPGAISGPDGLMTNYRKRNQNYMDYKVDFVNQTGRHEIKAGGHFQKWLVRDYEFTAYNALGSQIHNNPGYADSIRAGTDGVAFAIRQAGSGGYGYDEFMNKVGEGGLSALLPWGSAETDDELNAPREPYLAAMYINDKVEYQDIVVNAGLRLDRFYMDQWEPTDRTSPPYQSEDWLMDADSLDKADAITAIQPRIGLAFPVTDMTVFHLQYGRFAQMPDMANAYDNVSDYAQTFSGQYFITQPFAWSLDPIKTTQYEVGFQQQFSNYASFDITAFYKNTTGQIELIYQETEQGSGIANYALWQNGDFTTTKGFELTLKTRRYKGLLTQVNYTLSSAKGTNSDPSAQAGLMDQGTAPPSMIQPLRFQQNHRGTINLDYRTSPDAGMMLGDWGVNLLMSFNSGHHFTLSTGGIGQQGPNTGALLSNDARSRVPVESINASTTPWYFNTDLRVTKGFDVGGVRFGVYAYVQNLFNRKHVLNVYYRTGSAENDGFLSSPDLSSDIVAGLGEQYTELYRAINLENRQHWLSDGQSDIYGTPRQFRVGVQVEL